MWQLQALPLAGAYLIQMPKFVDQRGQFIKTFQEEIWHANQIDFVLKESYYSISKKDVIRGMHFQLPPHHHEKIVSCLQGKILDVIVDLRKDSGTYGEYYMQELSAENHLALYIPKGFAHGFKSLEDQSITNYLVSSSHHAAADAGIHYNSFGMNWQCDAPILSERDQSFPNLQDFKTPF